MRDAPTSTAAVQPAEPIDPAQRIADLEDALEQLQLDADLEAAELRSTIASKLAIIADMRRQLTTCQRECRRLVNQLMRLDADNAALIANGASRITFDAPELP